MLEEEIIKPFEVVCSSKISNYEKEHVICAIEDVIKMVELTDSMDITENYSKRKKLDDYIIKNITKKEEGFGKQVNIYTLLLEAQRDEFIKKDKYFVFLMDIDMFSDRYNDPLRVNPACSAISYIYNKVPLGFTLSTMRFKDIYDYGELLKTESYHELGHLFNAVEGRMGIRMDGTDCSDHCTEDVMRQKNYILEDTITITQERLENDVIYCPECLGRMKAFFDNYRG